MKFPVVICLLLFPVILSCQNALPSGTCGTVMPPGYKKWKTGVAATNNMVSTLGHDICVRKKFSIVFYVVTDTVGAWGVSPASLDTCVKLLNQAFARICVGFMNCSTVVIPNHTFNEWNILQTEPMVTGSWRTEKTICIYLTDNVTGSAAAYAHYPGGDDVIVCEKNSIDTKVIIHEMGHFFGLPHTWGEIGGPVSPPPPSGVTTYEFVDRTNCYTNGDGFCDTEADPYPLAVGAKDGLGKYYLPPNDNYMAYGSGAKCRFTQEQYNFMATVILTQRAYLH